MGRYRDKEEDIPWRMAKMEKHFAALMDDIETSLRLIAQKERKIQRLMAESHQTPAEIRERARAAMAARDEWLAEQEGKEQ